MNDVSEPHIAAFSNAFTSALKSAKLSNAAKPAVLCKACSFIFHPHTQLQGLLPPDAQRAPHPTHPCVAQNPAPISQHWMPSPHYA
ncbi:hypothetical protein Jann_1378 [Jannaschia sp. CCS1]|nr:hypothetical protein Jann_1378 [Jannaschia sp. CCS1]